MSLSDEIRNAVRKAEGLNLDQLMEALPEGCDRNNVNSMAGAFARAGEFLIAAEEGRRVFRINPAFVRGQKPAKAAVPLPRKPGKPRLDTNKKQTPSERMRDYSVAAESVEKTLKALQVSVDAASNALHGYLLTVADPAIYSALKLAHTSAQAALDAFVAQGNA